MVPVPVEGGETMSRRTRPWPVAQCDMHPEGGRQHYWVVVMKNAGDLRKLARHLKIPRAGHLGGFAKWSPDKNVICMVGLHAGRGGLSPRVVSHEFTHAALMFLSELDDLPKDPIRSPNERLCHLVGDATAEFYIWARAKGLYE